MTEISNKQIDEISQFWVVYRKENGQPCHIQLSACANNFRVHRGYDSGSGLQCVGLRYEEGGSWCYELFNVGHTLVKFPQKPGLLLGLLKGKNAAAHLRQQYEDFEKQLNEFGWKTIEI